MNISKYKIIALYCLLLNQLLIFDLQKPLKVVAKEENIVESLSDYIRKSPDQSFYILGPGDIIELVVSDLTPDLNTTFVINSQGRTNLKRINNIYASGLTLEELKNVLNKEYAKYVKEPDVELTVRSYRRKYQSSAERSHC